MMLENHADFIPREITTRDLPACTFDNLHELDILLSTTHPRIREKVIHDLIDSNGAYITKLIELFEIGELSEEKPILRKFFEIFYSLMELCDREIMEHLLSDSNFLGVLGVFKYNPGLLSEVDFRACISMEETSQKEESVGLFHQVIPIHDSNIIKRIHMNFRIHVIKDNVLPRSLPDNSLLLLDQMANENNNYILAYIQNSDDYIPTLRKFIDTSDISSIYPALRILKEILQLVRITRPIDSPPTLPLPAQRRIEGLHSTMILFPDIIKIIFEDHLIFTSLARILGTKDENNAQHEQNVALVVEILLTLVFYEGPDRIRKYLTTEGNRIAPPNNDTDEISWQVNHSSLFTALLVALNTYESSRGQMLSLLREIFKVSLGHHDDMFLNIMYPNYVDWILQPLKTLPMNTSKIFSLQDTILELLTFCTEVHGYRVKYFFGRHPIGKYITKALQSSNKLVVLQAMKFVKACVIRDEAFFSRFLLQNDLLTITLGLLRLERRNDCAVTSSVLELLQFIARSHQMSLINHLYTTHYEKYHRVCPSIFEEIRKRYVNDTDLINSTTITPTIANSMANGIGNNGNSFNSYSMNGATMVPKGILLEDEEDFYWSKFENQGENEEEIHAGSFVTLGDATSNRSSEDGTDGIVQSPTYASPLQERDILCDSPILPQHTDISTKLDENELQLPIRETEVEDDTATFLAGGTSRRKFQNGKKSMFPAIQLKIKDKLPSSETNGYTDMQNGTTSFSKKRKLISRHGQDNDNATQFKMEQFSDNVVQQYTNGYFSINTNARSPTHQNGYSHDTNETEDNIMEKDVNFDTFGSPNKRKLDSQDYENQVDVKDEKKISKDGVKKRKTDISDTENGNLSISPVNQQQNQSIESQDMHPEQTNSYELSSKELSLDAQSIPDVKDDLNDEQKNSVGILKKEESYMPAIGFT